MNGEFERIARLEAKLSRSSEDIALGIGDDCAVLRPGQQAPVWTIDAAFEGVHFSRELMSWATIARRAMMAAVSDIAAMGGRPTAALIALGLPPDFSDHELDELGDGFAEAVDALSCPVAGGNLSRADRLSITTSVLGACHSPPVTRAGARPGERIFVTGPLGGSALGLAALRARRSSGPLDAAIERFLRPRARVDLAAQLATHAGAAIDLSDGLYQDLKHLCAASDVGAQISLPHVPTTDGFEAACGELGLDPAELILGGGEDYELLFTAAENPSLRAFAVDIGEVRAPEQGVLIRDAGSRLVRAPDGFDHFSRRS